MIKMLVCVDPNFAMGYKGELLYEIQGDLQRFREMTFKQFTVAGRKTFESIMKRNGKPLPNRTNIVLTSKPNKYDFPLGVFKFDSIDKILSHYKTTGEQQKDLVIIGGSNVYEQFLPHTDIVEVTYVDKKAPKADTYFLRELLEENFYIAGSEKHYSDKYDCDYYYVTYKRK